MQKTDHQITLIVHTFNKKEAEKYGEFTRTGNILTERYWPGPLTIILQTKKII